MSVIAWDGNKIAADRQIEANGIRKKVSKLFVMKDGSCASFVGNYDCGLVLVDWLNNGADVAKWPECQKRTGRPILLL